MEKTRLHKILTIYLLFVFLISLIPIQYPVEALTVTWYVSTTGSDSTGTGTLANPFRTVQKAINASSTSDDIRIRGGYYNISGMTGNNGIYLNRSGTLADPYTIQNYTGETVYFNGSRVAYFQAWYGAFNIGPFSTASNITISGINFINYDAEYVLRIHDPATGAKDNIRLQHLSFTNCTNYTIAVTNTHTTTLGFTENIEISNCSFTNLTQWVGNPYEGMAYSGVRYGKFMYNTIRNCGKNNFAMTDNTMWVYVHHNRFFCNYTINYLDPGSTMIGTDGGNNLNCSHIFIFDNYFWGNNISAICIDASEHAGGRCENISIHDNEIHTMCWGAGSSIYTMGIMLIQVDPSNTSKIKNATITHNSVYLHNGSGAPFYTETIYQNTIRNIVVANNNFVTSRPSGTSYVIRCKYLLTSIPSYIFRLTNNTVNRTTGGVTKAYWYGTTGTYYGSYAVNASPQFVSRFDLHLNATSPSIGKANITYTTPYDYDDAMRPQGGTYDIGAYEYIASGTPYAPVLTNPIPTNGSTSVSLPVSKLNITVSDQNADALDIYFRSNSTGSWVTLGSNLSVFNGTYRKLSPGFLAGHVKYWWSVNVTDGSTWTNRTYNFILFSPTAGVTVRNVHANWTTTASVNITWTKGVNTTNTYIYRGIVGYPGTLNLYSGTGTYYNDTGLTPTIHYYYTIRPHNAVFAVYGNPFNLFLTNTNPIYTNDSGSTWLDFKGWLSTDRTTEAIFQFSDMPDFSTYDINTTLLGENYTTGYDISYGVSGTTEWGQSVTTGSMRMYLSNITLYVERVGLPGLMTVEVWEANTSGPTYGKPSGTANTTGTYNANLLSETSMAWVNVSVTPYYLKKNTKYVFMVSTSSSGGNYILIGGDSYLPTYTGGYAVSTSDGITYTNHSGVDLLFKQWSSTPFSYALYGNTTTVTINASSNYTIRQNSFNVATVYYYRGYANDTQGNTTLGQIRCSMTRPEPPTFLTMDPHVENNSLYITWVNGTGADRTIIVNGVSFAIYPTIPSQGVILYNGTASSAWLHNISFNVSNKLSLFSFTDSMILIAPFGFISRFSLSTTIPWGGISFNCYNESTGLPIGYDILIADMNGTYAYYDTDLYGYNYINTSDLPYGDHIGFFVSNNSGDYNPRLYYYTIETDVFYNFSFFLPVSLTIPIVNNSYLYHFYIYETEETEYTTVNLPLSEVKSTVKRYVTTTNKFETVSILYSDSNGMSDINLVVNTWYKVFLNKSGYNNNVNDYVSTPPNAYGQTELKSFRMTIYEYTGIPISNISFLFKNIIWSIQPEELRHDGSFKIYYNITSSDNQLEWYSLRVLYYNDTTYTWVSIFFYNATNPGGGTISFTVPNITGRYAIKAYFKKSGFPQQELGETGSLIHFISYLKNWMHGVPDFAYYIVMLFIMIVVMGFFFMYFGTGLSTGFIGLIVMAIMLFINPVDIDIGTTTMSGWMILGITFLMYSIGIFIWSRM